MLIVKGTAGKTWEWDASKRGYVSKYKDGSGRMRYVYPGDPPPGSGRGTGGQKTTNRGTRETLQPPSDGYVRDQRVEQLSKLVLDNVPEDVLRDLPALPLESQITHLKNHAPEIFDKLAKGFQEAGVNWRDGNRFLARTLTRKNWSPAARAAMASAPAEFATIRPGEGLGHVHKMIAHAEALAAARAATGGEGAVLSGDVADALDWARGNLPKAQGDVKKKKAGPTIGQSIGQANQGQDVRNTFDTAVATGTTPGAGKKPVATPELQHLSRWAQTSGNVELARKLAEIQRRVQRGESLETALGLSQEKRGRGRPRIHPVPTEPQEKRSRGRPRVLPIQEPKPPREPRTEADKQRSIAEKMYNDSGVRSLAGRAKAAREAAANDRPDKFREHLKRYNELRDEHNAKLQAAGSDKRVPEASAELFGMSREDFKKYSKGLRATSNTAARGGVGAPRSTQSTPRSGGLGTTKKAPKGARGESSVKPVFDAGAHIRESLEEVAKVGRMDVEVRNAVAARLAKSGEPHVREFAHMLTGQTSSTRVLESLKRKFAGVTNTKESEQRQEEVLGEVRSAVKEEQATFEEQRKARVAAKKAAEEAAAKKKAAEGTGVDEGGKKPQTASSVDDKVMADYLSRKVGARPAPPLRQVATKEEKKRNPGVQKEYDAQYNEEKASHMERVAQWERDRDHHTAALLANPELAQEEPKVAEKPKTTFFEEKGRHQKLLQTLPADPKTWTKAQALQAAESADILAEHPGAGDYAKVYRTAATNLRARAATLADGPATPATTAAAAPAAPATPRGRQVVDVAPSKGYVAEDTEDDDTPEEAHPTEDRPEGPSYSELRETAEQAIEAAQKPEADNKARWAAIDAIRAMHNAPDKPADHPHQVFTDVRRQLEKQEEPGRTPEERLEAVNRQLQNPELSAKKRTALEATRQTLGGAAVPAAQPAASPAPAAQPAASPAPVATAPTIRKIPGKEWSAHWAAFKQNEHPEARAIVQQAQTEIMGLQERLAKGDLTKARFEEEATKLKSRMRDRVHAHYNKHGWPDGVPEVSAAAPAAAAPSFSTLADTKLVEVPPVTTPTSALTAAPTISTANSSLAAPEDDAAKQPAIRQAFEQSDAGATAKTVLANEMRRIRGLAPDVQPALREQAQAHYDREMGKWHVEQEREAAKKAARQTKAAETPRAPRSPAALLADPGKYPAGTEQKVLEMARAEPEGSPLRELLDIARRHIGHRPYQVERLKEALAELPENEEGVKARDRLVEILQDVHPGRAPVHHKIEKPDGPVRRRSTDASKD